MSPISLPEIAVRIVSAEEAPAFGQICFDAFRAINRDHGFPSDSHRQAAIGLLAMMFPHSVFHCVVAQIEGRIAGSNRLDERSTIAGVGPITIHPR